MDDNKVLLLMGYIFNIVWYYRNYIECDRGVIGCTIFLCIGTTV